jgi:hypothetical protein
VTGSVQEGTGTLEGNKLRVQWQTLEALRWQSQGAIEYTVTTLGELYGWRTVDRYVGTGREAAFPKEKQASNDSQDTGGGPRGAPPVACSTRGVTSA